MMELLATGLIAVGLWGAYLFQRLWGVNKMTKREALAWNYLHYDDETLAKLQQTYLEDFDKHIHELEALRLLAEYRHPQLPDPIRPTAGGLIS